MADPKLTDEDLVFEDDPPPTELTDQDLVFEDQPVSASGEEVPPVPYGPPAPPARPKSLVERAYDALPGVWDATQGAAEYLGELGSAAIQGSSQGSTAGFGDELYALGKSAYQSLPGPVQTVLESTPGIAPGAILLSEEEPEIPRAAARGMNAPLAPEKSFQELYDQYLQQERSRLAQVRDEHPIAFTGGDIAGTVGTAFLMPSATTARGLSTLGKMGVGGLEGAALGAVEGAGRSTAEVGSEDFYRDVGDASLLGGAFGTAAPLVVPAVAKGARWVAGTKPARVIAGGLTDMAPIPSKWKEGLREWGGRLVPPQLPAEEAAALDEVRKTFGTETPGAPPAAQLAQELQERQAGRAQLQKDRDLLESEVADQTRTKHQLADEKADLLDTKDQLDVAAEGRQAQRQQLIKDTEARKQSLARESADALTSQQDAFQAVLAQAHTGHKKGAVERLMAEFGHGDVNSMRGAVDPAITEIREVLEASLESPANFPGQSAYGSKKLKEMIDGWVAQMDEGVKEGGAEGAAKIFDAADRVKRQAQAVAKNTKDRTFHHVLDNATEGLRTTLERSDLWGDVVAKHQKDTNSAWRRWLGREDVYDQTLMRNRGDLPQAVDDVLPDPYQRRLVGDETKTARLLEEGLGSRDTRHVYKEGVLDRQDLMEQLTSFYDRTDRLEPALEQGREATGRLLDLPGQWNKLAETGREIDRLAQPDPGLSPWTEASRGLEKRGRDLGRTDRALDLRRLDLDAVGKKLDAPVEALETLRTQGPLGKQLAEGLERGEPVEKLRKLIPPSDRQLAQRFQDFVDRWSMNTIPMGQALGRQVAGRAGVQQPISEEEAARQFIQSQTDPNYRQAQRDQADQ